MKQVEEVQADTSGAGLVVEGIFIAVVFVVALLA